APEDPPRGPGLELGSAGSSGARPAGATGGVRGRLDPGGVRGDLRGGRAGVLDGVGCTGFVGQSIPGPGRRGGGGSGALPSAGDGTPVWLGTAPRRWRRRETTGPALELVS